MLGKEHESETRLVGMAAFSLTDLAGLDDVTVAEILDELTARGRSGVGAEERYVAQQSGVGRCAR